MYQRTFNLTFLSTILLLFASCSQNGLESITLNSSGNLGVKILDSSEQPVEEASVFLYNADGSQLYQRLLTDKNGLADFGAYNPDTYLMKVSTDADERFFEFTQLTQVVSGVDKVLTLNLAEYYAQLEVEIYGQFSRELFNPTGYTMTLVHHSKLNSIYNQDKLQEAAELHGISVNITDGIAHFQKVPAGFYFGALHSNDYDVIAEFSMNLERYEEDTYELYVNEVLLNLRKKIHDITSVKNAYNSTEVAHNYGSIHFHSDDTFTLTFTDGGETTGRYSFYYYSNQTVFIDFSWDMSSQWSNAEYNSEGNTITLTTYDYNANADVVITLE